MKLVHFHFLLHDTFSSLCINFPFVSFLLPPTQKIPPLPSSKKETFCNNTNVVSIGTFFLHYHRLILPLPSMAWQHFLFSEAQLYDVCTLGKYSKLSNHSRSLFSHSPKPSNPVYNETLMLFFVCTLWVVWREKALEWRMCSTFILNLFFSLLVKKIMFTPHRAKYSTYTSYAVMCSTRRMKKRNVEYIFEW